LQWHHFPCKHRHSSRPCLLRMHVQCCLDVSLCGCSSDVCIAAAVRTPMGSFQGSLASFSATDLGAIAIKGEPIWALTQQCRTLKN
jgi:hypothetical protein